MLENAAWVVPAVREGYAHREEIAKAVGFFTDWLNRKKQHLVVTGMSGVGKTVLYDYLVGNGFEKGYSPPKQQSEKPESGKVLFEDGKTVISVFPGQKNVSEINRATSKLVEKYGTPDGIIHVVSNGLAETRNPLLKKDLEEKFPSIKAYQEETLVGELDDLKATLDLLRQYHDKDHKPSWLVVAATKCDLYADNLANVSSYYDPEGDSEFVATLKEFQKEVGERKFRWSAKPVCCSLVPFVWEEEILHCKVTEPQRNKMVDDFIQHLGSY